MISPLPSSAIFDNPQQNVGPDLDPNYLTLMIFLEEFLERLISKSIFKHYLLYL